MKKLLLLMLVAVLSVAMLTGCSSGGTASTDPAEITGETFDAGNVSALVPNGWTAYPVTDLFDEYEGDYDPTAVQIVKGAESEFDVFSKPYIQINYYGEETQMISSKDFYDDAKDIEPMQIGNYSWNGFTTDNSGYPTAILWTEGDVLIQLMIILENNDKISLDDADVQAIIASITPTK